jgi:uncharacterized protein (DUF305 family)
MTRPHGREESLMHFTRRAVTAAIIPAFVLIPFFTPSSVAAQDATPTMIYSCETAMTASPMAGMEGMAMGTPGAGGDHDMAGASVEFDQLYIDMMMPHHESIIALAQAAKDQLTDERLQTIAANIITAQQAETEELRGYREQWYGSPEAMPMDASMMGMMMEMMPGMGDMASMQMQMDPNAQVASFCGADDPDLAFIDLTIPHHEMAIMASEAALEQATHPEIQELAQQVIDAQQREIDELSAIRQELTGEATPAA